MTKKALLLFSGGLDSRVSAKMLEEQGFQVELAFVKLPFGGGCCNNLPCIFNFAQTQGFKLHIVDATKGEKFEEYVKLVRNPKYGRGTAINPCKDCKIFIFKEGKKLADEIGADVLATGEVLGQRPMSQMKKALLFDEEMAGLKGKMLRPLSAKLLEETDYEKSGLVDRSKLLGLQGRRREVQMKMADKYNIKYPTPAGGCLLCEKDYSRKLSLLFDYFKDRIPKYEEILLLRGGRMFKKKGLVIVGRNEKENVLFESAAKNLDWHCVKEDDVPGPSVVFDNNEDKEFARQLREVYIKKNLDARKEFENYRV